MRALRQRTKATEGVESAQPLGLPFYYLLASQCDHGVHQRILVRKVPVQLGLAGSGSGPDVVKGGGVNALEVHEVCGRVDDTVPCRRPPCGERDLFRWLDHFLLSHVCTLLVQAVDGFWRREQQLSQRNCSLIALPVKDRKDRKTCRAA